MSREVDVKALVSHIVRGDGADKCRICMGDTSEGQVYLGDTVMMDGDKAVTLAELLELITGVEVLLEEDLPSGLCRDCFFTAMSAGSFRSLCRQAAEKWSTMLQLLGSVPIAKEVAQNNVIFAIIDNDQILFLDRRENSPDNGINAQHSNLPRERKKRIRSALLVKLCCECPDCGKKFKYARDLHKHLVESMDNKTACYICASIMSRQKFSTHMKKVHNKNIYKCKKCKALFQTLKQLKEHTDTAHYTGAHSCVDCGRSFKSPHAFHGHLSMHAVQTCPGCDKLFRNYRCYLYHVKSCCNLNTSRKDTFRLKNKVVFEVMNHKRDKKVKVGARGGTDKECICDYCGKTFAGKKFVCAHIQIVHLKNTLRPCQYCGTLVAAAHMSVHLKKHEETPLFKCEHCGVTLTTRLGYIQHIRLHTGEKPYACKYCKETFSASSRRCEHIRKKHTQSNEIFLKHACSLCPARFRLPYRLKRHILAVHGKEDTERHEFECEQCHVKFSSCRGLIHHSRIHQNVKLKSQRKPHLKVHTEPIARMNLIKND